MDHYKIIFTGVFIIFMVIMYKYSWTVLIVTFFVLLIILTIYNAFWILRRSIAVNNILFREGDPLKFLEAIDQMIAKTSNKKLRASLLVNKTAGLWYSGQWGQALDLLESIDPQKLDLLFQCLHFNNKLACLNALDDHSRAQDWLNAHQKLLDKAPPNPILQVTLKGNRAVIEGANGNIQKSQMMLEECLVDIDRLPQQDSKLMLAVTLFRLGQLDIKENNKDKAKERLEKAARLAPNTFIPEKVQVILKNHSL